MKRRTQNPLQKRPGSEFARYLEVIGLLLDDDDRTDCRIEVETRYAILYAGQGEHVAEAWARKQRLELLALAKGGSYLDEICLPLEDDGDE